jgi:RNA-dependent RNA polymerase
LGLIAINWLIIADQSTEGILDPDCMVLAGLHSDAVDYQKSGMPVKLEKIPRTKFQARPDWNRPETGSTQGRFYDSQRAIGKLYRDIDLSADIDALKNAREQRKQIKDEIRLDVILADSDLGQDAPIDPVSVSLRLLVEEWAKLDNKTRIKEHHTILEAFETYRKELQYLCQTNTLSNKRNAMITEEEVVVGTIVAKCSQPRQRRDAMARLRERSGELVTTTKADIFGGGDNVTGLERSLQRAWFAWEVADRGAKHDLFGARSFGIIALGAIFEVLGGFDNSVRP